MDHMARDYRALLVGYFNETLLRENEREVAKALKAMADEGNTILNFHKVTFAFSSKAF